jgi:rSAM/selenodomain-associated transferase 2
MLKTNHYTDSPLKISIIIPTYNEEDKIVEQLIHLEKNSKNRIEEIIVVDGGSLDNTVQVTRDAGFTCLISKRKGRAAQMNTGYEHSTGDILYFVHADSLPPKSYTNDILTAIDEGFEAGCYRFRFDSDRLLLKINAFFTRFNRIMCRGGDQTLFITRRLFENSGGFREDFIIMEDYDLIQKIQKAAAFKIIPKEVVVSPRKYEKNSYLKVNLANFVVFMMYFAGASQQLMRNTYTRLIYHPKL